MLQIQRAQLVFMMKIRYFAHHQYLPVLCIGLKKCYATQRISPKLDPSVSLTEVESYFQ